MVVRAVKRGVAVEVLVSVADAMTASVRVSGLGAESVGLGEFIPTARAYVCEELAVVKADERPVEPPAHWEDTGLLGETTRAEPCAGPARPGEVVADGLELVGRSAQVEGAAVIAAQCHAAQTNR